jgi:hypothetical protein
MGCRSLIRKVLQWPVCFIATALLTPLSAPGAVTQRPSISMGPPPEVFAVQGDIVKMQIQYSAEAGRPQEIRWAMKSGTSRTISCKEAKCTLRTSGLKPGDYAIYIIVFDDTGSDSMKFDFRVAPAPQKYQPKQIEVPLVKITAESKESKTAVLPVTGQFLRTIEGRAFAHNRQQVRVIGSNRESLGKLDSIRTGNPGVLHFSITTQDEAWLMESGLARIVKNSRKKTFVKLERGAMRIRTLRNIDKDWNLASGGYVFTGTEKQDTIVIRLPGDEILVASLRGVTKVHRESTVKGDPDPDQFFTLSPGSIVRLKSIAGTETKDPGRPSTAGNPAEVDAIAAIIRKTTPQYLKARSDFPTNDESFIINRKPPSLQSATAAAKKYVEEKDPWLALEHILYRHEEAARDADASYLTGRSYLDAHLYPEAEEWLKRAIDPTRPLKDSTMVNEAKLLLGELSFRRKDWDSAGMYFSAVERGAIDIWIRDNGRGMERKFIIGKSCAFSERRKCAREFLPQVAISDLPADIRDESRYLLKKIPTLPGHTLRLTGSIGYNSNVFSLKDASSKNLPGNAPKNQDGTYKGSIHFDLRGGAHDQLAQDDQIRFGIAAQLDLEKSSFTTGKLASYALSHYDGLIGLFLTAPAGRGKPTNAFDGTTYVYMSTAGIGSQRVLDEAGGGLRIAVPVILGLDLDVRYGRAIDPQPSLDQILDPLTGEYTGASDDSGSNIRLKLGLVPFGPSSLTGEVRGRMQMSIKSSLMFAQRATAPGTSGDLKIIAAEARLAQKAVSNGVLSLLFGSEKLQRDITEERSSELGVPQQRTRNRAGLNYLHEVNQSMQFEVSTEITRGTAQPESFDSFTRSVTSCGLHYFF